MGNAPCQHAPLWLEGQKKYLDKSKVRKKLSENSTLIQLHFKWEAAASSLGMLHYAFYKLQEKNFHAEPLQKKFCTQAESNSHPPRLQHSTAPKMHDQTPGVHQATFPQGEARAGCSKMPMKGCTKPSLSPSVSGFSVGAYRHQSCSPSTASHTKSPARKRAASAVFPLV